MHEIQLRDAKATLSAVVDQALQGEPSIITRHGKREAVVLSFVEWERLSRVPSFARLLMAAPLEADDIPARDLGVLRDADLCKAERISEWLETLLHLYSARILPLDVPIARALGRLSDQARGSGHAPGFADLAIAATAQTHGYTVLTRNLRHFRVLGVKSADPFEALPEPA